MPQDLKEMRDTRLRISKDRPDTGNRVHPSWRLEVLGRPKLIPKGAPTDSPLFEMALIRTIRSWESASEPFSFLQALGYQYAPPNSTTLGSFGD
jgi:hypothetical protein